MQRSSCGNQSHDAGETSPLEASPPIRAVGETGSEGWVSWLVDRHAPAAFPRSKPRWPLAGRSPLTVARQRRILTAFPRPGELFGCEEHYRAASSRLETPASSKVAISLSRRIAARTMGIAKAPPVTEMLFAIGAGSQVIAADDQSNYPANAPTTKLSGYQPNLEAIAGYGPYLVVAAEDLGSLG